MAKVIMPHEDHNIHLAGDALTLGGSDEASSHVGMEETEWPLTSTSPGLRLSVLETWGMKL